MSIELMDDILWPDRIRVTIRGGQDIWITHKEAKTLADQLAYMVANPIPRGNPVKLAQLYNERGKAMIRYYFVRMVLAWMRLDIALTKDCIEHAKATLEHDQRRYQELQLELLERVK